VIEDPKFLEYPKSFRAAVAACYGVRDSSGDRCMDIIRYNKLVIVQRLRKEDNPGPQIDISRDSCDIVEDLGKLNPNSSDDETAGLLLRSPPDLWIKGSSSACADKDACWTVPAHKVLLGAHSEYFRSALGWHNSDEDEEEDAGGHVIHLDSDQFSLELVQQLVSACYGTLGYLANEDGNDDGNGWAYGELFEDGELRIADDLFLVFLIVTLFDAFTHTHIPLQKSYLYIAPPIKHS